MNILSLIAAFGGGVLGAYLGALPAFIMTGFFALIGGLITATGVGGDIGLVMGFGTFLGTHVAFAGGVAATAYAHKKGYTKSGSDIVSALYGLNQPDVLIVGGVTAVIGYTIATLVGMTPVGPLTDLPGLAVAVLGIGTRLVLGNTGLTGQCSVDDKRTWYTGGKGMANNVMWGLGLGIVVSFMAAGLSTLDNWDSIAGAYPAICFGFSAITLIFTLMGLAVPGSHHLTLPAGAAAVIGIGAFGPIGALFGVVISVVAALLGDLVASSFNSHCDTHIDPPAMVIFPLMIVINLIGGVL